MLIERPIFAAVTAEFAERDPALQVGPHDLDLDLGALINRQQQARIEHFLAQAGDLQLLAEGSPIADLPIGGC